jgi:hypothetical protein
MKLKLIILVVCLVLMVPALYLKNKAQVSESNITNTNNTVTVHDPIMQQSVQETIKDPVPEVAWQTYVSEALGVQFDYPTEANGEKVVVYEKDNSIIMTTQKSSYFLRKEELNNLTDLEKKSKFRNLSDTTFDKGYIITVRDASATEDIEKYIKEFYYPGCILVGLRESSVLGISDVLFGSSNAAADLATSDCFINWMTRLKYSEEFKKIAGWDIGQESPFFYNDPKAVGEDRIADSFRFIPSMTQ